MCVNAVVLPSVSPCSVITLHHQNDRKAVTSTHKKTVDRLGLCFSRNLTTQSNQDYRQTKINTANWGWGCLEFSLKRWVTMFPLTHQLWHQVFPLGPTRGIHFHLCSVQCGLRQTSSLQTVKPRSTQLLRISPESLATDCSRRWISKNIPNDLIRRNACQEVTDVGDYSARQSGPAERVSDASWDISSRVWKRELCEARVHSCHHVYINTHSKSRRACFHFHYFSFYLHVWKPQTC